ncbi:MAG: hypothetical protein HOP11_11225 [Saprospiraceae bacterium]|nr:hypothetical protein [Saprospiraceae bacterium]
MKFRYINQIYFLLVVMIITFPTSCTEDLGLNSSKSVISFVFSTGPYEGQNLEFSSSNTSDLLNYYELNNRTRVFCNQLSSVDNKVLKSNSSINFAWTGNPIAGKFTTLNFANPGAPNSGDIEIDYQDGEYLSANIPSNVNIQVNEYNEVGNLVRGSFSFSTTLTYEKGSQMGTLATICTVTFSLVRGENRQ